MQNSLYVLITGFLLTCSGQLFAHAGPLPHPLIESSTGHFLLHIGMTLGMGLGVFFLSRWVIQLLSNRQSGPKH